MKMYVEKKMKTVFTGTPTTVEDRKALMEAGFVHLTGLQVYDNLGARQESSYVIGEKLSIDDVGKWDQNNGKIVAITNGGEVWLRSTAMWSDETAQLIVKLCPKGRGAFVPLSNGETIGENYLLARIADPNFELVV